MFKKIRRKLKGIHLSLRMKLILGLSSIAAVLVISNVISIMEYTRMSNYVSELIADDISSINLSQQLSGVVDKYNLDLLTVVGDESVTALPDFDQDSFVSFCDSLKGSLTERRLVPLADSVLYSYSAYMLTSLELKDVLKSDFIDTRTWYFETLQPVFNRLRTDLDKLSEAIYRDLQRNSETFERGFYRSIIPGVVAVGVGVLLVFMLLLFMNIFYVNPLYRMLDSLDNYRKYNKRYNYTFEGDDQLTELNSGIMEITEDNRQLKRRIKDMKERKEE